MKIVTFAESNQELNTAIEAAEDRASTLLESLSPSELYSVQTQTLVETSEINNSFYFHIITVVYE
jgi:hypothetical protein